GHGVGADSQGNASLTGTIQQDGVRTPLVLQLDAAGAQVNWALSFDIPGSGNGLDEDAHGNSYVTGTLTDGDSGSDLLLAKISPVGEVIYMFRYHVADHHLGGNGIRVGPGGRAYVAGFIAAGPHPSDQDVLVVQFSADGSAILDSAIFGGSKGDTGMARALAGPNRRYRHGLGRARLSADVETDPCVFVTGETASSDFAPISETAFQQAYGGGQSEAFVTQLDIGVDSVDCPECVPKLTDGSYNNLTGQV